MYQTLYHSSKLENASFLITGGAGFIGSNIIEYLLKYDAGKVRVLDNFSTGYRSNIEPFLSNPAFELIEGDIRSEEDCKRAVEGIDFVSHQAALGSVPRSINDPITTNAVNISGFLNMLVAAKESGSVKRMVYAASSSTYGDSKELPKREDFIGKPLSPYGVTKYVNELYANVFSGLYGFHTVGLRYFNVFGPKQSPQGQYAAVIPLFIKAALEKKAPSINGNGEQSRDFTFVENAVQANIRAMLSTDNLSSHEVVNIACGESITLNQLWDYIQDILNVNIPPVYGKERVGDIPRSLADISKAGKLLGYEPVWKVREGLKLASEYYNNQTLSR